MQESCLRAFRYFDGTRERDIRVWLLAIVRNTFLTWVQDNRGGRLTFMAEPIVAGGNATASSGQEPLWTESAADPEMLLQRQQTSASITALLARLPADMREVLVLREFEELSYRDIAAVIGIPEGTVMSRLARARASLKALWQAQDQGTSR